MASEEYGISGHGCELAVEDDPVGNPNNFVVVGGLNSDVVRGMTREFTATMPHSAGVDGGVVSNYIMRGEWTFENNYIPGNAVFDGIILQHFKNNQEFKARLRGPGGSAGNDEQIHSGKITSIEYRDPAGPGQRILAWTFRPIGAFEIDGVTYD